MFTMPVMLPFFALAMAWVTKKSYAITIGDVIGLFVLWSVIFEVIRPMMEHSVADPLGVVAYAAGGLVFILAQRMRFQNKTPNTRGQLV